MLSSPLVPVSPAMVRSSYTQILDRKSVWVRMSPYLDSLSLRKNAHFLFCLFNLYCCCLPYTYLWSARTVASRRSTNSTFWTLPFVSLNARAKAGRWPFCTSCACSASRLFTEKKSDLSKRLRTTPSTPRRPFAPITARNTAKLSTQSAGRSTSRRMIPVRKFFWWATTREEDVVRSLWHQEGQKVRFQCQFHHWKDAEWPRRHRETDSCKHEGVLLWRRERVGSALGGREFALYLIFVKNRLQFLLVIDLLSAGLSFCQVSRVLHRTKEHSWLASIGIRCNVTISKYARYACAVNLQKVYKPLENSQTFSVNFYMSTHMNTSYLDIRIHSHIMKYGIINLHVLAVPLYEPHAVQVIFDTATRALDVLCPFWQSIIIGVSTDGEKKMPSHITGLVTWFYNVIKLDLFAFLWCSTIWPCPPEFICELGNSIFYTHLSLLILCLWRQQNRSFDMQTKEPEVSGTRSESMSKVGKWFKKHVISIVEYLGQKSLACVLSHESSIRLMVISKYFSLATKCFKILQGHHVTAVIQCLSLVSLRTSLLRTLRGEILISNQIYWRCMLTPMLLSLIAIRSRCLCCRLKSCW